MAVDAQGFKLKNGYLDNPKLQLSWLILLCKQQLIKHFSNKLIIIAGTSTCSQDVDIAAKNPIKNQSNIMYTFHFYAQTSKQWLRNKAQLALNNGLPIFITESGVTSADGNGTVDLASSNEWWKFVDGNGISQINWAMNDKNEGSAAMIPGTPATLSAIISDANSLRKIS
uniref:Glycoside hydrolase family 5 domain-containing protein n=1 Tax=Ditylenchus dipsaci TaxID=166011 RepID=A0A915DNH1_9BILA